MMSKNKPAIKLISIIPLLALLISQPVFSVSYGKPYQADNSEIIYSNSSVNQNEMLPSEITLNETESVMNVSQAFVLLGADEDPFDPGAGDEDPNAYNDVPLGDGLNLVLLLAVCYGIFTWLRVRKTYKSRNGNLIIK